MMVSWLVEWGQDTKLGRWTYHILCRKGTQKVLFVSGYRVCQTAVAGPLTAATQQWSLLKKAGIQYPNPRKQFFTNLAVQVKKWIGANCKVCVMLDANKAPEDIKVDYLLS